MTMRKSLSVMSVSLLTASLMIPVASSFAANPPGNHRQREELRRDQRQLEELRRQRNRELHEGDWREAREYNGKIHDKQREIFNDRRDIYGDHRGWSRHDSGEHRGWSRQNHGWWDNNNGWWRHERPDYDYD
jgi:hypothetical protein